MDERSYFATKLLELIRSVFSGFGFSDNALRQIDEYVYVVVILLIAWLVTWVLRRVISYSMHKVLAGHKISWLTLLVEHGMLRQLFHLLPPLIISGLLPFAFSGSDWLYVFLVRITWIWFVVALIRSINILLRSVGKIVLSKKELQDRPMKSFIQILQVLVVFLGVIVVISILIGKSPLNLVTGLGAFAAVLMLVFKDTILGFVAGVLLAENDMVHLGDWIEMPSAQVNGIVIDITLTVVKVRNWDNTIVTVPPYSLVTGSFINWRGMKQSGGRRIMRGFTIVHDYVKPCTPLFLERMKAFDPDLAEYIIRKQQQAARGIIVDTHNPEGLVDGSIETNLGLLRAYLALYLRRHPDINSSMQLMIRCLPPTDNGLPLQLYCFSKNKIWEEYESIQSGIMEHVLSILPVFELHAYQNTSLRDNVVNGLLEGGYEVEKIQSFPWGIIKS